METSGLRRMVSPAGFASAAEASSARPRNAPPMPRERAPGLPKLNCRPERDSMSVFWAKTGRAAVNASKKKVLRMAKEYQGGAPSVRPGAGGACYAPLPSGRYDCLYHLGRRSKLLRAVLPPTPFNDAVGQALRPHGDPQREADQIRILELHARALVAVVEEHVDAGGEELRVDLLGRRAHGLLFAEGRHDDGERRDRDRPDDAVVVVALLHRGGDRAADPKAIAAHDHRLALAVLVEERAAHRLGVLRAELEHVPDLDAAVDLQRRLAARARIAGDNGGDVRVLRLGEVAAGIRAAEVIVLLVTADDPVDAAL